MHHGSNLLPVLREEVREVKVKTKRIFTVDSVRRSASIAHVTLRAERVDDMIEVIVDAGEWQGIMPGDDLKVTIEHESAAVAEVPK